MRWSLGLLPLASLAGTAAAQAANQVPLGGDSAPPSPSTFQEKASTLFEQGKRLASVYLGSTPVDVIARDQSDKQAGVVRLTDENWDEEMAAWDGDWAIVIHGHQFGPALSDPASTLFVAMHDNATRMARDFIASPTFGEKDVEEKLTNLKKVKWARFDYITEWEWCARWMVTRPPWLVFVSNHGNEMRFLGTRSISAEGRKLFSFMAYHNWDSLTTWKPVPFYSRCAEIYIKASHKIGDATANVPRWVWFLVFPALTQAFVKYVYFGGDQGGQARPVPRTGPAAGARGGAGRVASVPAARKNA